MPPLTEQETNAPGAQQMADGAVRSAMPPEGTEVQPAPEQIVEPPQTPTQPIELEEPVQSPTVISTDSMRQQLSDAQARLNTIKAEQEAGQQPQPEAEQPETVPQTPKEPSETDFIDEYTRETNKLLDQRKNEFNRFMSRSDNLLKSQVRSIQGTFEQRRQQAEKVAVNAKAATNVLGARTGRMRYAPEIQRGIITGQENALIETLASIDAQEMAAIAAAESAAFDRDYGTFLDKIESLDGIRKEREKTLNELEEAMKTENQRRENEAETMRQETLIIEQFAAGVTDPVELFQALNGEVPYDMIVAYSNTLPEETVVAGVPVSTVPGGGVSVGGQVVPSVNGLTKGSATMDDIESLPISAGAKPWVRMWAQGRMTTDDILSTMGTSNASQALKNEVIGVISQMEEPVNTEPTEMDVYIEEQAKTAKDNIEDILRIMNVEQREDGSSFCGPMFGTEAKPLIRVIGQFFPGTDAKDIRNKLDTVEALIGFDALADMRAASPTGGALGQVTERELKFLQSVRGSLDMGQSTKEFLSTLKEVYQSFDNLEGEASTGNATQPTNSLSNASLLGVEKPETTPNGVPSVLEGL